MILRNRTLNSSDNPSAPQHASSVPPTPAPRTNRGSLSQGASCAVNSPPASNQVDQPVNPGAAQGSPLVRDLTLFWDSFGFGNNVRDGLSSHPPSQRASPSSRRTSLRSQIFSRPNTPDSQQVSQALGDISQELQNISGRNEGNLDQGAASEAASNLANLSLELNNVRSRLGRDSRRMSRVERLDRSLSHASLLVEHSQLVRDIQEGAFVHRSQFQEELNQLKHLVHNTALSTKAEILDQVSRFVTSTESRIIDSVIDRVRDDYNRVGISCIRSKTSLTRSISELNTAVNSIQVAISELQQGTSTHEVRCEDVIRELASLRVDIGNIQSVISNYDQDQSSTSDNNASNLTPRSLPRVTPVISSTENAACTGRDALRNSQSRSVGRSPTGSASCRNDRPLGLSNEGGQVPCLPGIEPVGTVTDRLIVAPQPQPRSSGPALSNGRRDHSHSSLLAPHPFVASPVQHPFTSARMPPASDRDHQSVSLLSSPDQDFSKLLRLKRQINVCGSLIHKITDTDMDSITSKAQVIELTTYEAKTLQELKHDFKALDRKLEALDTYDEELYNYIEDTYYSIMKWEGALDDLKRRHHLHLAKERSLLKNIELSVFDGSAEKETVYEFLSQFTRLTECTHDPQAQADLLFNTYLSREIRDEISSRNIKTDFTAMKKFLIAEFGVLEDIAEAKLKHIACLKHPSASQPMQKHVDYYKQVAQLLHHIESLCKSTLADQAEVANILHHSTFIKKIVGYLPDEILKEYVRLTEKQSQGSRISGQHRFDILLQLITRTWHEIASVDSIRSTRDPVVSDSSKRSSKAAHTAEIHGSVEPPSKARAQKGNDRIKAGSRSSAPLAFPCPIHDPSVKAKHEIGHCRTFFQGTNQARMETCKKLSLCFSCLKKECLKASRTCLANLPNNFLCEDCKGSSNRRVPCILLCPNNGHARPTMRALEEALLTYFKALDTNLLDSFKACCNLVMPANPLVSQAMGSTRSEPRRKSLSSPVDKHQPVPAFDTHDGALVNQPFPLTQETSQDSVYIFQDIRIGTRDTLIFYDSGATGNLVVGKVAEDLGFKVVTSENQMISSVANRTFWTEYGVYTAILGDRQSGFYQLTFQGISEITSEFPRYDWAVVNQEVLSSGKLAPSEMLPPCIGGRPVDILIGIHSCELVPRLLFTLPSGIAVFRCPFLDQSGSSIAYGGSHKVITQVNSRFKGFKVNQLTILLSHMARIYASAPWCDLEFTPPSKSKSMFHQVSKFQSAVYSSTPLTGADLPDFEFSEGIPSAALISPAPCSAPPICNMLDQQNPDEFKLDEGLLSAQESSSSCVCKARIPLAKLKNLIEQDEEPIVSYRCPQCSDCEECRKSPSLKATSLRERTEQRMIEESVRISYADERIYIKLPFLQDPVKFFSKHFMGQKSNMHQAKMVYLQQCKKPDVIKEGVRKEFDKLLQLGFVLPLDSLPTQVQDNVRNAPISHIFPWRSVHKPSSLSTPVRLVVDPSSSLLNCILAKGESGLSSMFSILLRARSAPHCWTADIRKLYNCLYLEEEFYNYSLFLYHTSLDPTVEPQLHVLVRAWYGVCSTSGQASVALKRLGEEHREVFPKGASVLSDDCYVDDILPSSRSISESFQQVDEVQKILQHGGMSLKFVAHSGQDPPPEASTDGASISVLGYKWFPNPDLLSLHLGEVNFNQKRSGERMPNTEPANDPESIHRLIQSLPSLTRQQVVSKTGELYDPLGLVEPFKASLKRALSRLNHLEWKDPLPETEYHFWVETFKMWPDLSRVEFPRSTVPPEDVAHPLKARLITCSDASSDCGGCVVYVSFKLNSGQWSCRVLAAKSRILKYSVPRNELDALVLGVELTYAVIVSLNSPLEHVLIATDSLVALAWACNDRAKNKTFVFNRILTISRFLDWMRDRLGDKVPVELVHISGSLNPADQLTKGVIRPFDLGPSSSWQLGNDWMSLNVCDMPLTRYEDITLSKAEVEKVLEEAVELSFNHVATESIRSANYLVYSSLADSGEITCCAITSCVPTHIESQRQLYLSSGSSREGTHKLLSTSKSALKTEHLVDLIYFGWLRSNKILRLVIKFCLLLVHRTHLSCPDHTTKRSLMLRCLLCPIYQLINANSSSQISDRTFFLEADGSSVVLEDLPGMRLASSYDCCGLSSSLSKSLDYQADFFPHNSHVGSEPLFTSADHNTRPIMVDAEVGVNSCLLFKADDSLCIQATARSVEEILELYFDTRASNEARAGLSSKELSQYETHPHTGVLYYKGRLSPDTRLAVQDLDLLDLAFLDKDEISFHCPPILPGSDIFQAYALHCHYNLVPHGGIESTLLEMSKRFYPVRPRKALAKILAGCIKCRLLRKKRLQHEMSPHSSLRTTIAPPFAHVSIDLAQNFSTKTRFAGRQVMNCPALIIVCILTGATGIYAMEDWSTQSVVQCLERHSARHGIPSIVFVDSGTQLKKLKTVTFDIADVKNVIKNKMSCELVVSPPKAHSSQGKVERKIGLIKNLLERVARTGLLQSFLNWETTFAMIANHLNNLPISRPSANSVMTPEWSILTPNRLLLGRNNNRSLVGPFVVDCTPSQIFLRNCEVQKTFLKLLVKQIHLFIPKSKWFTSDQVFLGDLVMFFIGESELKPRSQVWHYGRVVEINGKRLTLEYTLFPSNTKKLIERSKRDVVRIASEDELCFNSKDHKDVVVGRKPQNSKSNLF